MRSVGWALVQYRRAGAGAVRTGVLADGKVVEAPGPLGQGLLLEVLRDWDSACDVLREWRPAEAGVARDGVVLAPLTSPPKIICAGANYYSHAAEMGTGRPDPAAEPFFFFKPPTTTVIGPGDPIPLPAEAGSLVDWEAEL